eukprot:293502_1
MNMLWNTKPMFMLFVPCNNHISLFVAPVTSFLGTSPPSTVSAIITIPFWSPSTVCDICTWFLSTFPVVVVPVLVSTTFLFIYNFSMESSSFPAVAVPCPVVV